MKRAIHSLLKTFGYRVGSHRGPAAGPRASEQLRPFLAGLKRLGFAPRHIVDVGANHGCGRARRLELAAAKTTCAIALRSGASRRRRLQRWRKLPAALPTR